MQSSAISLAWADLFTPCNKTELYQICRRNGIFVPPNTPREDMVEYILGTKEPPEVGHPIDAWRHGIMGVIIEHADVVQATLNCPAKTLDPLACFQCPDTQVMSCLIQNPNDEPLIATRRIVRLTNPRKTDTDMTTQHSSISIATAPRQQDQLAKLSAFRLLTLASEFSQTLNPRTNTPFFPARTDTSPESKSAWAAFSSGSPAVTGAPVILALLQQYDQIFGGGQPAVQPQAVAPMAVQPTMAAPGPQLALPVGPAVGLQPMQLPTATTPVQEPTQRGGKKVTAPAELGEVIALIKGLSERVDVLTQSFNSLAALVIALKQGADVDAPRIENIESLVRGIMKATLWQLGVSLNVAEAVLQAPLDTIAEIVTGMQGLIPDLFEKKSEQNEPGKG